VLTTAETGLELARVSCAIRNDLLMLLRQLTAATTLS
jgi:hypothetical protein